MTHFCLNKKPSAVWDDCWIDRYESNNGIVLKLLKNTVSSDVLVFLDGADIGVQKGDPEEVWRGRAEPIFKAIPNAQRWGYDAGVEVGRATKLFEIKQALEI